MQLILTEYIRNPERMNAESLVRFQRLLSVYPYFQPLRLLYLLNLYRMHDMAFDRELRKAALFLPDRKTLFHLIEGMNYVVEPEKKHKVKAEMLNDEDRTGSLISSFLDQMPEPQARKPKRVDASTDYIAYLLQMEETTETAEVLPLQHQNLIDSYISKGDKRIVLNDKLEDTFEIPESSVSEKTEMEEDYFTETLAKIYIKQGRYTKALEIIRKLSLNYPKKNRYFADQIRFLEKLIINNKNKK